MASSALSGVNATVVSGVGTPASASARLVFALFAQTAAVAALFTTGTPYVSQTSVRWTERLVARQRSTTRSQSARGASVPSRPKPCSRTSIFSTSWPRSRSSPSSSFSSWRIREYSIPTRNSLPPVLGELRRSVEARGSGLEYFQFGSAGAAVDDLADFQVVGQSHVGPALGAGCHATTATSPNHLN